LGQINGRRFGFSAGVGLAGEIVRAWEALEYRADGRRPGDLAFLRAAAHVVRHKDGKRAVDTMDIVGWGRAAFAFAANSDPASYLGRIPLHFAPNARFEGGLDLIAARSATVWSLLGIITGSIIGQRQRDWHDRERFEVRCDDRTAIFADGEDLGDATEVLFEMEPHAIGVLV
jgi:diacylglycerol kinase family enzyme